ncbi:MAG: PCP reductase family protein [Candidatus Hydrogenedentes bacterium]|nr:PCP reductase family protein [Candidatus Hydrogenedentota bacterium]
MKFLCVPCDERMNLLPPDAPVRGSMTVVYRCPSCAHEIAMMTNPYETEVVSSLGVKIGGKPLEAAGAPSSNGEKTCPFAEVVARATPEEMPAAGQSDTIPWTSTALERLENIPEFVRPMAKKGIEKMAIERDYAEITEEVLDQAKDFFGM